MDTNFHNAYEVPHIDSFSEDEVKQYVIASATRCPVGTTFTCGPRVNFG